MWRKTAFPTNKVFSPKFCRGEYGLGLRLWYAYVFALVLPVGAFGALVTNGDFEGPFAANGVAEGWLNDSYSSWGDYDIAFARDTEKPHTGMACQRITCNRVGYISATSKSWIGFGAAQLRAAQPVPLRQGMVYKVVAWLRGDAPIEVFVQFRQNKSPWWPWCEERVVVTPDWQKVEFLWTCGTDDPNAWFMFRFAELGTLWIDDVLVEEISAEEAKKTVSPPPSGNLLHNGDFDLELANWSGAASWQRLDDSRFSIALEEEGPCLRAVVPQEVTASITSDVVPLTPGYPVRVSCRIRADKPVQVTLFAYRQGAEHAQWPYCSTSAEAKQEWQHLEASGEVPFLPQQPHAFVRVAVPGPATVWLDDVELRQDGESGDDEEPRAAFIPDRYPFSLYHDNEKPRLRFLSSVPAAAAGTRFQWQIQDFWGKTVLSDTWQPGEGRQIKLVPCDRLHRGWYLASVAWEHGGRAHRNEATFCILPPASRSDDPDTSPFGGHHMIGPAPLRMVKAIGSRWMRLWPPGFTLWKNVEPEKGKWHFDDEEVQVLARREGLRLVGLLESPPKWASAADPSYWQDWETYVARVVERYKDDISVWEVQNEPNLRYWLSKPGGPSRADAYLEYLKHTYPVVKRVNPRAVVMGGCVAGHFAKNTDSLTFTEELIDKGALEYMDVLSFHYYHSYAYRRPIDEEEDPISEWIPRIRARMKAAGKVVPIINSEGGVYNPASALTYRPCAPDNVDPIPPTEVARLLVRLYVSQLAAGVERFFYYDFFLSGSPVAKLWDSFVEGDGQPRPCVAAYAVMTWLLEGAKYERTERPINDLWVHYFATPRGKLAVAWSRTGTRADFSFRGGTAAWDIMGKNMQLGSGAKLTLTPDPTYVLLGK